MKILNFSGSYKLIVKLNAKKFFYDKIFNMAKTFISFLIFFYKAR